jgi:cysteinyl-tRNA synthetase
MRLVAMLLLIASLAATNVPFFYMLQDMAPAKVPAETRLLVIDATADGLEFLTPAELEEYKAPDREVLAYVSVGEAEDYRYYWQNLPRDLLLGENPEWPGNWTVKYWDPRWHKVVKDYIKKVLDIGFDGVYLDKVDAYWDVVEYGYGEDEAAGWMKELIEDIRLAFPDTIIYLQNGDDLIHRFSDLADMIDGMGVEDLFFDGRQIQPWRYVLERLMGILALRHRGKPVFVVDYVWDGKKDAVVESFCYRCRFFGFSCYAAPTDRSLSGGGFVCPSR